jgi:hypothetical protein
MTTSDIENQYMNMVLRERRANTVLNNVYIDDWECDIVEITKSGYLYEYEVKISVADFKQDARKRNHKATKHEVIQSGERCAYFYYIVPENIITTVPDFAGLIYAYEGQFKTIENGVHISSNRIFFRVIKTAPKLSKNKVSDRVRDKIMLSAYYKYHNIRKQLRSRA